MDNILKQVQNLINRKQKYIVGRVISTTGSLCVVKDTDGNELKVTGLGYTVGNHVLVENQRIISRIEKKLNRVWIP